MPIIDRPSPNQNDRPSGIAPDMIVVHYTGMMSCEDALQRLCDPDPDAPSGPVSSHYTIDVSGDIYAHVLPEKRAWHAGISHWKGRDGLNDYSIGIELVNAGHEHGYTPFPDAQIEALMALMRTLRDQFDIPLYNIVGHQDIAPIRKQDPGHLFPWGRLACDGLALLEARGVAENFLAPMQEAEIRKSLSIIGFNSAPDVPMTALVRAFCARFMALDSDDLHAINPDLFAQRIVEVADLYSFWYTQD